MDYDRFPSTCPPFPEALRSREPVADGVGRESGQYHVNSRPMKLFADFAAGPVAGTKCLTRGDLWGFRDPSFP